MVEVERRTKFISVNIEEAKDPVLYDGKVAYLLTPSEWETARQKLNESETIGFGLSYLPYTGLNLLIDAGGFFLKLPVENEEVRNFARKGTILLIKDQGDRETEAVEVYLGPFLTGYLNGIIDLAEVLEREALKVAGQLRQKGTDN